MLRIDEFLGQVVYLNTRSFHILKRPIDRRAQLFDCGLFDPRYLEIADATEFLVVCVNLGDHVGLLENVSVDSALLGIGI